MVFMTTTVQTFHDLLAQRPFQAFRLAISNGDRVDVRGPAIAMLTRTSLLAGMRETVDGAPDHFRIGALLDVAAVEPFADFGHAETASSRAGVCSGGAAWGMRPHTGTGITQKIA